MSDTQKGHGFLKRLSEQFTHDQKYIYDVLCVLQQHSNVVFAGGCCQNETNVKDIDVFILNSDVITWKLCMMLFQNSASSFWYYHTQYEKVNKSTAVIQIALKNEPKIHFEFIFTNYESTDELLANFDMDYIRIALHQLKFVKTMEYKHAKRSKEVQIVRNENISYRRFAKALKKDFRVFIACNDRDVEPSCMKTEIKYEDTLYMEKLQTFQSKDLLENESFGSFMLPIHDKSVDISWTDVSITAFHETTCWKHDIHYLHSSICSRFEEKTWQKNVRYVSVLFEKQGEKMFFPQLSTFQQCEISIRDKRTDKEISPLPDAQHVGLIQFSRKENRIFAYLYQVHPYFKPIELSSSTLCKLIHIRNSGEHSDMPWHSSETKMSHIFKNMERWIIKEQDKEIPNYKQFTNALGYDIAKHSGDFSLVLVGFPMEVFSFDSAMEYLKIQYERFKHTPCNQKDYSKSIF